MSVIEIKTHPVTHIIVRDFLDSSSKKKLLNSLLPIRENHLEKGDRVGLYKSFMSENVDLYKRISYLHELLEENPTLNRDCIDILENNIWRDDLRQAYANTNNLLFRTYPCSNISSMLFSQYEAGEGMAWHNDPTSFCTASYIFQFDDRQFLDGGDFLLSGALEIDNFSPEKFVTYSQEDNFLIIFPSKAVHKITKISGYRYSLQYFVDYKE